MDFDLQAFAAERTERQDGAIEELRSAVRSWLEGGSLTGLTEAITAVWVGAFQDQTRRAGYRAALRAYMADITSALEQTTRTDTVTDAQVERIAVWLAASSINSGTEAGFSADGGVRMRWVSMKDSAVRDTHRATDGQTRAIGDPFDVGGAALRYPGDPTGPISEWINCRCILAPAGRRRGRMSADVITAAVEANEDEDLIPEEDWDDDEALVDDDDLVEIPVHGVAAPEGVPTGDGRQFGLESLTHRELPLPLRYEVVGTHGGNTSDVVTVGRLDELWREGNEYRYRGVIVTTRQYANEVLEGIVDGTVRGVSVDVDDIIAEESDIQVDEEMTADDLAALVDGPTVFSHARVAALTIVPIGAFAEAFIALGHAFLDEVTEADKEALAACGCDEGVVTVAEDGPETVVPLTASADTFAPGTKDGPGWVTHPRATARIRRYWVRGKGAAKIRWGAPGDFNRCRRQLAKYVQNPDWLAGLCANMHKEATGTWPGRQRGGHSLAASGVPAPMFSLVAAGRSWAPKSFFEDPQLSGPTAMTVDLETGRIFGHIATWNTCHIGIPGVCTTAPKSMAAYRHFHLGQFITDEGDVPVGHITLATGHAPIKASAQAAAAHYDNTGSVVADIAVGEDSFGIWFAGGIRPTVDENTARTLAAATLSGDWRNINGNLEMVGVLAVNVPGFGTPRTQLAASGGHQTALVAAGVVEHDETQKAFALDADTVAGIARAAVDEYRHQEKRERRLAEIQPLRLTVRQERIERVRALVDGDN